MPLNLLLDIGDLRLQTRAIRLNPLVFLGLCLDLLFDGGEALDKHLAQVFHLRTFDLQLMGIGGFPELALVLALLLGLLLLQLQQCGFMLLTQQGLFLIPGPLRLFCLLLHRFTLTLQVHAQLVQGQLPFLLSERHLIRAFLQE